MVLTNIWNKEISEHNLLLCLAGLYTINHDVIGDRQKKEVKILQWRTLNIWMDEELYAFNVIDLFIHLFTYSFINKYLQKPSWAHTKSLGAKKIIEHEQFPV